MPVASTTAPVHDEPAGSPATPLALVLGVAASAAALVAVVVGFALVAAGLIGAGPGPLGWGAGLCVGGWALAAVVRERQRGRRDAERPRPDGAS